METARHPDGRRFIRLPGSDWQEVDQQTYQQARTGRLARVVGGAVDELQDSIGFGLSGLGGALLETETGGAVRDPGMRIAEQNDPRQAARRDVDQVAATAGTALGIGAQVLAPSPAAIGGAGTRLTARGADRGIRAAQEAVQAVRGRADDAARRVGDDLGDGINAQRNSMARQAAETDLLTPQQADNMGMPLTSRERGLLAAYEGRDMARIEAAETALANEDFVRKSTVAGDTTLGDFAWRAKDKEGWFTRMIADELGRHDLDRLNSNALVEIRADAQAVFREAFDEGNYPVATRFDAGDGMVDVVQLSRQLRDNMQAVPATVSRAVDDLEAAAARGTDGAFDTQALLEVRKEMSDAMENAFKAGQYDTGSTLATMQEIVDDAIEAALPGELLARVQVARHRWKIKKVLERTVRSMSRTERGMVNPATFRNNWAQMTPGYRRHIRGRTEFERAMDTVDTLAADRAHTGNTLYRAVGPAIGATAIGAAGAAGLGAIGGLLE